MTHESTSTAAKVANLPVPARPHFAPAVDVFSDPATFEHAQRVAKVFAQSDLVPPHLRGNVANCLIAYQIARRLNEEPLTVFQNIYIVSGRPGWKTEYLIARANMAGVFKGRITWASKGEGAALSVTASAALADTGEVVSATCDMAMATAEQWTKNGKYKSMPEHMLRWRSAAMLIRLYAPEVMLGMPVVEELETLPPMQDVTPRPAVALKDTLEAFAANNEPAPPIAPEAAPEQTESSATPQEGPGAGQAAPTQAETLHSPAEVPTESEAASAPKTSAEYIAYCEAWIGTLTDAAAGEERWRVEKKLRNALHVTPEVRDDLAAKLLARSAELRGGT